ncbi:MAG: polysaccharide deacetylase family protein [Oceanicaulis sp.]|jgi:peptidoglycan/xylan/chitin deacetylase (PgdA/CDA1 family)|nr:polysaccharide deacetylase family protein [Oceanicaulis sp.]
MTQTDYNPDDVVYRPRGGLAGRVQQQLARRLGVTPLRINLDRPIVTFSFDDFPRSALELGAVRLKARGWRGTYYVSGGLAGVTNHHGELFDPQDLLNLKAEGHEIACHGFSHLDASRLPAEAVAADAARNRAYLKAAGLDDAPTSYAFAYGEATPHAKKRLLETYSSLRGVQPGINRGVADRGLLKSVPLDGGDDGLKRAVAAVKDAARNPGWLIFYGHDIQKQPSEWGCTPEFLDVVLHAVEQSGAQVMTQSDALAAIEACA